jgi:hypothetical protein
MRSDSALVLRNAASAAPPCGKSMIRIGIDPLMTTGWVVEIASPIA